MPPLRRLDAAPSELIRVGRAVGAAVYSSLAGRLATYEGEVYPLHVGDTWVEPADGCRMQDLTVEDHPGMHRYAPPQGMPRLLDAIVERMRERTGAVTERGNVLVTTGATGALGAVMGAILDPGTRFWCSRPVWPLITASCAATAANRRRAVRR